MFGGPFTFTSVNDGTPDNIPSGAITLANFNGESFAWIVTDESGDILGLPPTPSAVNFDTPPSGVCFIYHVAFVDDIVGLAVGSNISGLEGCFNLSVNSIQVTRTAATTTGCDAVGGTLTGGPFTFDAVGDGIPDNIPTGAITAVSYTHLTLPTKA